MHLRKKINTAFITQDSRKAFSFFRKFFDGNKWKSEIQDAIDKFGKGENIQFALLQTKDKTVVFVRKNLTALGLLNEMENQGNSDGTTTLLVKKESPKLN